MKKDTTTPGAPVAPKKYRMDYVAIFVSVAILAAIVVLTICSPDTFVNGLHSIRDVLIYNFGAYFIVFTVAMLAYNVYLAFSKYGAIRFGRRKPVYSTFGWIAMIFCAAMGCTILFWSAIEWAYYTVWITPFGMNAEETAELSVAYSFFHWGVPAWSIYSAGVVPIAYRYYVRQKPGLTLQNSCEGVLGDRVYGALGTVISIIFVFGVLGGYAISYGSGIPMLANIAHNLVGAPENILTDFILVVMVTALFLWSACSGIAKGIQVLSKLCVYMCLVICALFLILGHTGFEINNTVQSFGLMIQNFPRMLFYTDPTGASGGFPQEWSVFYWAWWLGLAPVMWIFIAKCSEGRSIRALIGTVIISGTAATVLFFGTISNHGLGEILLGGFKWASLGSNGTFLDTFYNTFNEFGMISDVIKTLPGWHFVLLIWFVTAFFLFVTTMDSASYTMAAACTKGLDVGDDPGKVYRILFACLLSVTPLCLLVAGSPLTGFKAVLIITSVPISILIIFCLISCQKWLMEDYGHWTAEEIKRYYAIYTEDENEKMQSRDEFLAWEAKEQARLAAEKAEKAELEVKDEAAATLE